MREVEELFAHVWSRHTERMAGLTDEEWAWLPTTDRDLGLRWRLDHVAQVLGEDRNVRWMGSDVEGLSLAPATSAAQALANGEKAWERWAPALATDLTAPVGTGPYPSASRLSFALHVADELVHHTAEAALLRDLWRAR